MWTGSRGLVSPFDNPDGKTTPGLVVSSYEPHGWRTCILLSPGTSPDTWPGEFQFTGSPRTSVLDFVTSGVDGVAWTRSIRDPSFLICRSLCALATSRRSRESPLEDRRNRRNRDNLFCGDLREIRGFSISKISLTVVEFSLRSHLILFSILILVRTNFSCKEFLLQVNDHSCLISFYFRILVYVTLDKMPIVYLAGKVESSDWTSIDRIHIVENIIYYMRTKNLILQIALRHVKKYLII